MPRRETNSGRDYSPQSGTVSPSNVRVHTQRLFAHTHTHSLHAEQFHPRVFVLCDDCVRASHLLPPTVVALAAPQRVALPVSTRRIQVCGPAHVSQVFSPQIQPVLSGSVRRRQPWGHRQDHQHAYSGWCHSSGQAFVQQLPKSDGEKVAWRPGGKAESGPALASIWREDQLGAFQRGA